MALLIRFLTLCSLVTYLVLFVVHDLQFTTKVHDPEYSGSLRFTKDF